MRFFVSCCNSSSVVEWLSSDDDDKILALPLIFNGQAWITVIGIMLMTSLLLTIIIYQPWRNTFSSVFFFVIYLIFGVYFVNNNCLIYQFSLQLEYHILLLLLLSQLCMLHILDV